MKKVLLIAIICTLVDQVIKLVITNSLDFGDSIQVINGFFSLTLLQNTGAAFSIFSSGTIILILVSLVALNLIYWFLIKDKNLNMTEKHILKTI